MKWILILVYCLSCYATTIRAEDNHAIISDDKIKVTVHDLDAMLQGATKATALGLLHDPKRVEGLAEQLYLTKVLAEEARQMGLAKDPAIQAQLQYSIDRFYLKLRLEALDNENLPDFDAMAKEQYLAHPDQYQSAERVHAQHILISENKKRTKQQAQELANSLHKRVTEGEDFSKLAVEFSDDGSVKQNSGDLGFFQRGQMVKAFEDAAFAMRKPGQVSAVIETQFGFHIIKLVEYQAAGLLPFDTVKAAIVTKLATEYKNSHRAEYLDKIKKTRKEKNNLALYMDQLNAYIKRKISQLDPDAAKASK